MATAKIVIGRKSFDVTVKQTIWRNNFSKAHRQTLITGPLGNTRQLAFGKFYNHLVALHSYIIWVDDVIDVILKIKFICFVAQNIEELKFGKRCDHDNLFPAKIIRKHQIAPRKSHLIA
ncbi:MAG: hypothetical protein ACD_39C01589G0001 [uncultured bacterium]|nr:MAG: hypothetical protein ACD_39C01589G0001 [uncultured bacterium]